MAEYQGDYYDVTKQSWHVNSGIYFDKATKTSRLRDGRYEDNGKVTLLMGEGWEINVICENVPDQFVINIWSEIEGNAEVMLIEDGQVVRSVFTTETETWEEIKLTPNKKRFLVRVVNRHSIQTAPQVKKVVISNPAIRFGDGEYGTNEWLSDIELKELVTSGSKVWVKVNGDWVQGSVGII